MEITPLQNGGQAGTTLSANVTATGRLTRTFSWTINKSVTPDTWNLFSGDSGTSQYTITVDKDTGTLAAFVEGQVCVTNGGAVATENLAINLELQRNPGGGFVTIHTQNLSVAGNPVLDPGETGCYNYSIMIPADQVFPGTTYRVRANVTITNHSGQLGIPFGPSPAESTVLPTTATTVNNSITVMDSFAGNLGTFSNDGSVSYNRTFTCDEDEGEHFNTAQIIYDNNQPGPTASAMVTVNCYELAVTKTATASFTRDWDWTITKTVSEDGVTYSDSITLTLPVNGTHLAYYRAVLNATSMDTDFQVEGDITISNPAPIPVLINSVSDVIAGVGNAAVNCGVNFPFLLAAGQVITCSYEADLPDKMTRLNTTTATIQNFQYDSQGNSTPTTTTDFSGTANIIFGSTPSDVIDETVTVSDDLFGSLGMVNASQVPFTINYTRKIGPYFECGQDTIVNTASFVTNDTGTTGSDTATVNVDIPCAGCTLTIGFWRTHAGFTGNNPDLVTQYLPIWLGTQSVGKSIQISSAAQAVQAFNFFGDASNGINRLYAQLLAAKLNIANGADPSAVSNTIAAADAFLAQYNAADWNNLTRQQRNFVNQLQTILDNYNNGLIGPGHCSESGEQIVPQEPDPAETPETNCCGITININITGSSNFELNFDRDDDE
ncbi:MAG: hypothetical protein AB2392_18580 [Neobacillus sp.]